MHAGIAACVCLCGQSEAGGQHLAVPFLDTSKGDRKQEGGSGLKPRLGRTGAWGGQEPFEESCGAPTRRPRMCLPASHP